jgi:hypothetical protein
MKKVTVPVTDDFTRNTNVERAYSWITYGYAPTLDLDYRNIDDVLRQLHRFKDEYGDKYDSLEFRLQCELYGEKERPQLYGTRDENELEKEARLFNEKAHKKQQEEKDQAEWERLSKKFNDEI